MARLLYNSYENCWECERCGGLYSGEEAERLFDYCTSNVDEQKQHVDNGLFIESYCMDCGALWDEFGEKD